MKAFSGCEPAGVGCLKTSEKPDYILKSILMAKSVEISLEEFFAGYESSRALFDAAAAEICVFEGVTMRVTRSQVAFRRGKAFAWLWLPKRYLRGNAAPLVLSICLPQRDCSPRWKEILEPAPGRWMHHLEIYSTADIDSEVIRWLAAAWVYAAQQKGRENPAP